MINIKNKYTLYIGLNDRDTHINLDIEKSIEFINNILKCFKYTYFIAKGKSSNLENTLIYVLFEIDDCQLKDIIDKILIELNQDEIIVESKQVDCEIIKNKL